MRPLRWLKLALSAAVLAGVGLAAAKYLQGGVVLKALHDYRFAYAVPVLLCGALYLVFKALRFQVLLRPVAQLPLGTVFRAYCAGQPATFVPGGVVLRAALLAELGVPPAASAVPIVHGSLLDQLLFVTTVLLVALWIPAAQPAATACLAGLASLGLVCAIPPLRQLVASGLDRAVRRTRLARHWDVFTQSVQRVSRPRTLFYALLWSISAYIVPVLMLQLILRGLHVAVGFPAVLLAYSLSSMAGRLTVLPGGLGATEGGMVALLHNLGGMDPNTAAAAAALHRLGDSFFQALLGGVAYFLFWHPEREPRAVIISSAIPAEGATG